MAEQNYQPHLPIADRNVRLVPFNLESVTDQCVTDFDLFINIGGHMVLYAPNPYTWSGDEVARLIQDGHHELFYHLDQAERVQVFKLLTKFRDVDEQAAPEKRVEQLMDLSQEFTKVLFQHRFTPGLLEKGKKITAQLLDCVQENPHCVQALRKLQDHHEYTYYHSGRVAAYSLAIALEMSMSSEPELESIGLGCLLHDLGKARIKDSILNKAGPLNEKEWSQVRLHPEWGVQLLQGKNLGLVPMEIILHHHEREDGRGYPHGLSREELLTEVKIAGFADIFDALTSFRPYQRTRSRFEALDFIRFHLLDHVYRDAFKAMVSLLG